MPVSVNSLRMHRRLLRAVAVGSLLTVTACSPSGGAAPPAETTAAPSNPSPMVETSEATVIDQPPKAASSGAVESSDFNGLDLALPQARSIDDLTPGDIADAPLPSTITIDRLGLEETDVLAVGVETNGDMTVPPPLDVGWYRYGPRPGEPGSAVLAGHVASGGVAGAFRHLDRLEPGDVVTVGFDDGSAHTFVVDELFQVDKTDLPFDSLFARRGPASLTLITCGGRFDYDARSYDDNIVVTARPLDS